MPFVGIVAINNAQESSKQEFVIVLDGLHDFGNIGTLIRTAKSFGIHDFISTDETLNFFYKKTIDTSRGTVFASNLHQFKSGIDAINGLKKQRYQKL